jgi:hypothetical protein
MEPKAPLAHCKVRNRPRRERLRRRQQHDKRTEVTEGTGAPLRM